VITTEKIEEWIKEVEERPSSAPLILRYIANRLRDLSERNEELLAENIDLRTRERVEEYERRINYLEYQLDLLKRQYGSELPMGDSTAAPAQPPLTAPIDMISLLVYDTLGHVLCLEMGSEDMTSDAVIARLALEAAPAEDPIRLLALPSTDELLFIYTSGRVDTLAVEELPAIETTGGGEILTMENWFLPEAIPAADTLACLAPISNIALCEYFVQISRRGHTKKVSTAMAPSILSNRYIGTGVKQPADQTFNLLLCRDDDRISLISREGYLLCVEVSALPFSIEETMRMGTSDHLVGAFLSPPDHALLVMTDVGKAIHRTEDYLESTTGFRLKGKGIYSKRRREEGVRVVGAGAVHEKDWGAALHKDGSITLHSLHELLDSGSIQTGEKLLAFSTFSSPAH
jgi:DNA gyrase/topoisomerase IV subunit A